MFRKFLAPAALLLLALPFAHADQASKRTKIQELITLTNSEQLMNQMVDQMSTAMKNAAAQQAAKYNFTPEQQTIQNNFNAKVARIIEQSLSMDNLRPVIIEVYEETYTEDELDGILAFYRSPAGKAFVAKTPQLLSRTMTLMQQQMATLQPQLEQATKELADEMAKTKK